MEQPLSTEQVILASMEDYQSFIISLVWGDLTTELRSWYEELGNDMNAEKDDSENHRNQGRRQAIVEFLELPHRLMSILEADKTRIHIDSEEDF